MLLTVAIVIGVVHRFDVPLSQIALYAGYLAGLISVPGTLLWRALRGARNAVEDIAAGTALGFALTLGSFIAAAALGRPGLAAVGPAAVVLVFLAVPRLRRRFSLRSPELTPRWWAWTMAGLIALAVCWVAYRGYTTHPFAGDAAAYPHIDVPFHLALAGELSHQFPPQLPYVAGEPLHYHWFAHASLAAVHTTTGIELDVILLRLWVPALLAVCLALTAITAVRISRQWWTGPVAIVIGFFVTTFSPFRWADEPIFFEIRGLADWWWQSPSQALGAALFAVVVLVLIDHLPGRSDDGAAAYVAASWRNWVLLGLLFVALVGAKGTFLPLVVAGCCLVVAIGLFHRLRRRSGPPLLPTVGVLALAVVVLVTGAAVLYRGEADGMNLQPLHNLGRLPVVTDSHLGLPWLPMQPWVLLAISGLTVLAWSMRAVSMAGLLQRRSDPAVQWLVGAIAGGLGATLMFAHSGFSEHYFLRSILPLVGVAAACGLAELVRRCRPTLVGVALAISVGTAAAYLAEIATPHRPPTADLVGRWSALVSILIPFGIFAALLAGFGVAVWFVRRRFAMLAVVVAITAAGLPALTAELTTMVRDWQRGLPSYAMPTDALPIPASGRTAARWLRDHSARTDIVATNAHCRTGNTSGRCDNRKFWLTAYAERRVLIEGWGYTAETAENRDQTPFMYLPFGAPDRLAANDRAFSAPSETTLDDLAMFYGVRWLFVDEREPVDTGELTEHAELRYRTTGFRVYRLAPVR